ncbi:sugar phosphate isomerase/epimerase family protein [Paenibacillus gorillae]|uniref:sugar phosphate isomerase/epimerase family protein n=1 Tax=Paenibacillus gorillae TaxID=1243662 RepID=UPI0004BBC029|nr:sugar phosphate isomerase/epimerase [Paenibacillus gorillae]
MNRIYGMDTFFYNSLGNYPFNTRCEMLSELGYDAVYLTLWDEDKQAWRDLERLPHVKAEYGLEVAAVYAVLDLALPKDHPHVARIFSMLAQLQGCSRVELALTMGDSGMKPSDPEGDALALERLSELLAIVERNGIQISLYHHVYFWLERWEDALRLVKQLNHPLLGITFSSFHWFAVDGSNLNGALSACAPYLHAVNLCGSRKQDKGLPASIECIDAGELDIFAVMGVLRGLGYEGFVGFQGYGMGGDPYSRLERNRDVYRSMLDRLERHPSWALFS